MESAHPFSVSFAPCFQAVLCRSQLFFRMFLDRLFQICADRFIMKQKRRCFSPFLLSPSSRRAWIEITQAFWPSFRPRSPSSRRAWIEIVKKTSHSYPLLSPSSRRAWIEIAGRPADAGRRTVALLAEGVDRNIPVCKSQLDLGPSPSSRRAWIEIDMLQLGC